MRDSKKEGAGWAGESGSRSRENTYTILEVNKEVREESREGEEKEKERETEHSHLQTTAKQ